MARVRRFPATAPTAVRREAMNLDDLQAELARQNAALETANTALAEMGDVQIQIPEELPGLLPSVSKALDTPLGSVGSLLPAGVCYRALRRLPGQDLHLLEQRVFQDAPCPDSTPHVKSAR